MWKQLRHMNEDSEVVNYLKQKTFSPLEKALCRKKKKNQDVEKDQVTKTNTVLLLFSRSV